jgi:WD40 repeat protein
MLVDWKTGNDIFELDTNIDAANTSVLEWSPNCQYLVTHQDQTGIIYDVLNGRRLAAFDNMRGYNRSNPSAVFDQTSTYLTIEAGGTTYLHKLLTGETFPLIDRYFQVQYFDYVDEQLIAINRWEVAAYDLNNGAKVASFGDLNLFGNAHVVFSPDRTTLAFSSNSRWAHVINRDTLARIDVRIGFYNADREHTMALSPNNRYLAVGASRVDVWDLQNLQPIEEDSMPSAFHFSGPDDVIRYIHFVDSNIIEVITQEGASYWNMTTGEQVGGVR